MKDRNDGCLWAQIALAVLIIVVVIIYGPGR